MAKLNSYKPDEDFIERERDYRTRFLQAFGRILGKDLIEKWQRGVNPRHVLKPEPSERPSRYDPVNLWEVWQHAWALDSVFRVLSQEIMKNGWSNPPKFKFKCENCEREYQETVETCSCGKSDFREPDGTQLVTANRITTKPNEDWTFTEYLSSLIQYELALGNEYVSFGHRRLGDVIENAEFYIEDARYIVPVADVYNHLGDPHEMFCPRCWDRMVERFSTMDPNEINYEAMNRLFVFDMSQLILEGRETCRHCNGDLVRTAYKMEVNDKVQARWGKEEMVHGSMMRVAPALYGVSKLVKLWKVVETMQNMDDYNWEVYGQGHIGRILQLAGYDEHDIAEVQLRIDQELQKYGKRDAQTGALRIGKKIRVLLLGSKRGGEPLAEVPFMPDLESMQSYEFYLLYWIAVCSCFGLQPVFSGMATQGRTGTTPILQIRVQDRTTKDHMAHWEDFITNKIYPKFKITDYKFQFNQPEERDELREAQKLHTKSATMLTLRNAGIAFRINDLGDIEILAETYDDGPIQAGRSQEARTEAGGAATGVESIRPEAETRESERTSELVMRQDVMRIPVMWEEASKMEAFGKLYQIGSENREVYLMINGIEVSETRMDDRNIHEIVSAFVQLILNDAQFVLQSEDLGMMIETWTRTLRREYNRNVFLEIGDFFDRNGMMELARKFDSLRDRLDSVLPTNLEDSHVAS